MKFSETRISDNNTTHMGLPEVWFFLWTLVARSTFSGDSMGGMGGQGGFRGNIDPEELFRSQDARFSSSKLGALTCNLGRSLVTGRAEIHLRVASTLAM